MEPLILTRAQVRRVDELAIRDWGMSGLVLMENAGRGCVDLLERLGIAGPVVICCGRGNNGGDGFVMARHLELRGHAVKVLLWSPRDQFRGDAAANLKILARTDVPIIDLGGGHDAQRLEEELGGADWIVDALLGSGASGAPRPPLDEVIGQLNRRQAKKFAVDLPSGLDCDSGDAPGAVFRADHTGTFVSLKPGLAAPHARRHVGQAHVLDIGAPPSLIRSIAGRR